MSDINNGCQFCEQLVTEINYIRDVEIKHLEGKVQESCNIINQLYEMISIGSVGDLEFAENFIRENYIPTEKNIKDSMDDLPF